MATRRCSPSCRLCGRGRSTTPSSSTTPPFFDAQGGAEPQTPEDDKVWTRFAYDWSGITRERDLSLMRPGQGFPENAGLRYTLTPREDQLIL